MILRDVFVKEKDYCIIINAGNLVSEDFVAYFYASGQQQGRDPDILYPVS